MENILKQLFDFQCFQENSHLAKIITETESSYGEEINDDDLVFVSAAGEGSCRHCKIDSGDKNE